jgi:hypothetical protein
LDLFLGDAVNWLMFIERRILHPSWSVEATCPGFGYTPRASLSSSFLDFSP